MAAVRIWRCALRAPSDAEVALLDPLEVDRAATFRFDADRHRFVLAAALARAAVAEWTGGEPANVGLDRTCDDCGRAHGRPTVRGGGPHLSISHAGDLVVVAVSDRPVGIDVEETSRWSDAMARLVDDVAAPGETIPVDDGGAAFFSAWTRKEAVLKATGDGLRIPMRDVRIRDRIAEVGGTVYDCRVTAFGLDAGHVGAVAVLADEPLDLRMLDR